MKITIDYTSQSKLTDIMAEVARKYPVPNQRDYGLFVSKDGVWIRSDKDFAKLEGEVCNRKISLFHFLQVLCEFKAKDWKCRVKYGEKGMLERIKVDPNWTVLELVERYLTKHKRKGKIAKVLSLLIFSSECERFLG